jgi:hypothetical protein
MFFPDEPFRVAALSGAGDSGIGLPRETRWAFAMAAGDVGRVCAD